MIIIGYLGLGCSGSSVVAEERFRSLHLQHESKRTLVAYELSYRAGSFISSSQNVQIALVALT